MDEAERTPTDANHVSRTAASGSESAPAAAPRADDLRRLLDPFADQPRERRAAVQPDLTVTGPTPSSRITLAAGPVGVDERPRLARTAAVPMVGWLANGTPFAA